MLASCGSSFDARPADPALRALVDSALAQSVRDSILYVASSLAGTASLNVEMTQGSSSVRIRERFTLDKGAGKEFVTKAITEKVVGDTSILRDMYSFRPPGTKPRPFEATQMDRMNFAGEFRALLRRMLAGKEKSAMSVTDSAASIGGKRCWLISFETDDGRGSFAVNRENFEILRIRMEESSDYVLAGYAYSLATDYARPAGGPAMPVSMNTKFEYHRPLSHGAGSVSVVFDTLALR